MPYDVIALGELLIDFTENGVSSQGNPLFEANPGGAPCNVLAMLSRLGKKTSFLGVVGKDQFGHALRRALGELGIDASHLYTHPEVHTTLAFVHTLEGGERDFAFYRNPGADMTLTPQQVEREYLLSARAFHFGTLSMTHETVREATRRAIALAEEGGMLLSFDPNLRPPLWQSPDCAREQILYGLEHCHLLKISDEEVCFVTGCSDPREGARRLVRQYPEIRLLNLTLGREGSVAFYEGYEVFQPSFLLKNTIETTGAGDTFGACVLSDVLDHGLGGRTEQELQEMLRFANAAAALMTTRKGALRVMPTRNEIQELLQEPTGWSATKAL